MKSKVYNLLLILTSLFGYLEWGGNNHQFLFEAEAEIFSRLINDPLSVIHPLVLLPLAGQILLLITLFQRKPSKILTFIGMGGLGILLGFMALVGVLGLNYKIVLSVLPFLTIAVMTILFYRKTHS
ncbi:MAG TPA: hypothetical protein PKM27_15810 [Saprospiraceae bacterium]|nr:hypothetical protein [Saprospiraceae bacterium]HNT21794.1 hypothetical protein [Saprospiraceae bacterium]